MPLYDGKSSSFTMHQSNTLALNGYRYSNDLTFFKNLKKTEKNILKYSKFLISGLILHPLTHEEGHRSVLTNLGIGSVSKPFFNNQGVAKVTGVTNEILINLRDNNLKNYIRLHSAGLESDYCYLNESDKVLSFGEETNDVLLIDYLARKLSVQAYYLSLLFPSKIGINEYNDSETDRDIVGHDIYGMIRHLHRPNMNFHRYTEFDDLTDIEKKFVKRIGLLSLFNLLNPNIIGLNNFRINKNIKASFSVNYSLAPFGDFLEQNLFVNINNKYKINPYGRQFFNGIDTFYGVGAALHNYECLNKKLIINTKIDFWNQPKDLNFNSEVKKTGLGLNTDCAFRIHSSDNFVNNTYLNFGFSYKTEGFIPEKPSLEKDFAVKIGFVFSTIK